MRQRIRHSSLLVALLWVATTVPLLSQPVGFRDRDPALEGRKRLLEELQRARLQYGPFYLLSRVELRNLGFDQEINIPTREELEDLTFTVGLPHKLYFVPAKKFILSAQVEPAYLWFREREELRHWNYLYRGDVHLLFNRLYIDAFAAHSDETVRDLSELSQLVDRKTDLAGIDTEIKLSGKSQFLLRHLATDYQYDRQRFPSGIPVDNLERREHLSTFKFRHRTFPRTALSLLTELQQFDFEAGNRDGKLVAVYAGADREGTASRLIEEPLQLKLGFAKLDYDNPSEKDYEGPLGSATVTASPYRRVIVTGQAERKLEFSVFENNNHYAADRVRFTANYNLGRRTTLIGTLEGGVNRYFEQAFDPADARVKTRQDDIRFQSIAVSYRVARNSRVGVGVGYYERQSNFVGFSEDGIRLLFQLSISP